MRRLNTHSSRHERKRSAHAVNPAGASASVVNGWWASVLAGNVYEPHPIHGADLKIQLDGGRLRLSGELESDEDRKELVRQARERIDHGIDRVDASNLTVARRDEKPGILDQTLVSAFPSREAAEFARTFVIKHSRVVPKQHDIVDANHPDKPNALLPGAFVADARKALQAGQALLIMRIDETVAHRVRELLEEDTRSEWTIAAPPHLSKPSR